MDRNRYSRVVSRLLAIFAVALTLAIPAWSEWTEKVLYSFQGGTNDGSFPVGSVVFGSQGDLYGVLQYYGPPSCAPIGNECGAIFQLTPPAHKDDPWTETLIYHFQGKKGNDGESPNGGLLIDGQGNLYGVTAYGGTGDCLLLGVKAGCGTVYKLSPPKQKGEAWKETILYSFPTAKQGYLPDGNLAFDSAGNLYGATVFGGGKGTTCDAFYQYCGAVFELSPPKQKGGKWTENVLHSFEGGTDGANPNGGLVLDHAGSIFGTTAIGGNKICQDAHGKPIGCGIVFQLRAPAKKDGAWTEKILHRFTDGNDGAGPSSGLIFDAKGALYGTTGGGGSGFNGTVFRLTKTSGYWAETILYSFSYENTDDGSEPGGGLTLDKSGGLYGPAGAGGTYNRGLVYRLKPAGQGKTWLLTVLYDFQPAPDACGPGARLTPDGAGKLYSTTPGGGTSGNGTVFSIAP
jgi:hypothetical protein